MEKAQTVVFLLMLVFAFTSTASASDKSRLEALENKIINLEKRIEVLEGKKDAAARVTPLKSEVKNQLKLGEWSYSYIKKEAFEYYRISYELINGFDKKIKLIDASIRFEDLLGEELLRIKINPDLKINSRGKIKKTVDYKPNMFMEYQFRMKDMDKSDVIVKLIVRKIVFEDNTIMEY